MSRKKQPTPVEVRRTVAAWWAEALSKLEDIRVGAYRMAELARDQHHPLYKHTVADNWDLVAGRIQDCGMLDCDVVIERTDPLDPKGGV